MWHAITEFLLRLHSQGLSHEAVIEIMVALLSLMIAVLTLVAALFAVVIAVIGFFGYTTIRDEAVKRADKTARVTARRVARSMANGLTDRIWSQIQASGMSEGQSESDSTADSIHKPKTTATGVAKRKRRRATSDSNLKEGGGE